MTDQDRMNLEGIFRDLETMEGDISQLLRNNGEWAGMVEELAKFKQQLLGVRETMSTTIGDARRTIMGDQGSQPSPPSNTDQRKLTKQETAAMEEKMKQLNALLNIGDALVTEVVNVGAMGPEEVMRIYNDFIDRMLAALPDGNAFKETLKHLRTRIEGGDEIESLLAKANKLRPVKKVTQGVAAKQGLNLLDSEVVRDLGIGGILAGLGLAAPGLIEKASKTDIAANLGAMFQQALSNAVSQTDEVEVVEEEDIEEEIEVEETDRVSIEI